MLWAKWCQKWSFCLAIFQRQDDLQTRSYLLILWSFICLTKCYQHLLPKDQYLVRLKHPHFLKKWAHIPDNVDVLITHTPPAGILDRSRHGRQLGCPHLADRVSELAPAVHCFGHVHASGGVSRQDGTTFVNQLALGSQGEFVDVEILRDFEETATFGNDVIS